jgi:hypothetical protein
MLQQCGVGYAGRGTVWFCIRPEGHEGDHRGSGRQWTQKGRRRKCSMSLREVNKEWEEARKEAQRCAACDHEEGTGEAAPEGTHACDPLVAAAYGKETG